MQTHMTPQSQNSPTQPSAAALDFQTIGGVVLDMDGVLWRSAEILPGVPDFFLFLRDRGIPFVLATNNSSRTAQEYVTRASSLGIPIDADHVVTSGQVTADELARSYPRGTPIYVIGSDSLIGLMVGSGYVIDPDHARVVVVGLDMKLTYDRLQTAGRLILAGAEFIGTNGDRTLPTPDGLAPGNGSILAAIQTMTERAPRLMGKPEPAMFHAALKRLKTLPEHTLMIGDRLDTDIAGAQRAGLRAALVLSGVSGAGDVGSIVPDAIYDDLAALFTAWKSQPAAGQHA
jgi:4-nitrophenyl phosphatase